jgi:hypothetical protein
MGEKFATAIAPNSGTFWQIFLSHGSGAIKTNQRSEFSCLCLVMRLGDSDFLSTIFPEI